MTLIPSSTVTKLNDCRGVSPVIATILVVAIVVIISASIAAVTFGFTDQLGDPVPTTSFEFSYNSGWEITHTQGDQIDPDKLQIQIEDPNKDASGIYDWPNSEMVSAGVTVKAGISNTTGNEEVTIVWNDEERSYRVGGSSSTSSSSDGGGADGGVASINGAFANNPTTASNKITVSVVDGDGNPVADEELTVSVVDSNKGLLTVYDSSGSAYSPEYDNEETLTVTTNSAGEFKTAIGNGYNAPVGNLEIGPRAGNVNLGDSISVKIESSSTSVEQTITYEYNN